MTTLFRNLCHCILHDVRCIFAVSNTKIMELQEILKMNGATLVDVRSADEFDEGTVVGAINIPLHTIPVRVDEFRSLGKPVIVFCRSGARSFQASTWLKRNGVDVYDGGGIANVASLLKQ
jgi:phage shock protein E